MHIRDRSLHEQHAYIRVLHHDHWQPELGQSHCVHGMELVEAVDAPDALLVLLESFLYLSHRVEVGSFLG